jgi:hypothetical protein
MHMGHVRRSAGFLLLFAISACGSGQGAKSPDGSSKGQTDESGEFAPDATEAVAKLVALWTIGATAPAETPTGWHRHEASGTCTATGSASWVLRQEHAFGPGDEAVTLWNENLGSLMTLYTYPQRQELKAEFESVIHDLSGTCTEGPLAHGEHDGIHYVGCVKREEGFLLLEQAQLSVQGKWLNKVRTTFPDAATMDAYGPTMAFSRQSFVPCP